MKLIASLSIATLLIGSTAGHAQTIYTGATTLSSPVFNRPLAGTPPTSLSGVGTAVHYSAFTFTAPTTASYSIQSVSNVPVNWDNFLVLYQGTFNPASPLTNIKLANDDNPTIGLAGFTGVTLTQGTQYVVVTTGFANTDVGTFTNTITPGIGSSTPGPDSLAVFAGMGLTGIGALRRRRRK